MILDEIAAELELESKHIAIQGHTDFTALDATSRQQVRRTARLSTPKGELFVKMTRNASTQHTAEADGLRRIAEVPGVNTPKLVAVSQRFLVIDWVDTKPWTPLAFQRLGASLSALHQSQHTYYGYPTDNWIGNSPQANTPNTSWAHFFVDCRIQPQFRRLWPSLPSAIRNREMSYYAYVLATLSDHRPPMACLHGDLWNGNILCRRDDVPVFIDPAIYFGDPETDIAMTQLFGGFGSMFYTAYARECPTLNGHQERAQIYNLYHVLNHANLFGGSYVRQAIQAIDRYT